MMIQGVESILPATKAELYQSLVAGRNRGLNRPLAEVKADLLRPIPLDYISQKPIFERRNGSFSKTDAVPYISWTDCLMILDYICPEYDYEVFESQVSDRVVVKGRLTLHCQERDLTVEALGHDDISDISYGGAICDASAMALRRCLASIGLGRYLYYPDSRPKSFSSSRQRQNSSMPKGQISREEWQKRQQQRSVAAN
jgi:hypothetical protein